MFKWVQVFTSSEDFQRMKSNITNRRDKINYKLESLNPQNTSIGLKLEHVFNVIRNMPEILSQGRIEHKIRLLGLMFPEKIQFDGEKYQTNYSGCAFVSSLLSVVRFRHLMIKFEIVRKEKSVIRKE